MSRTLPAKLIVIGAGPAGLTAAFEAQRNGIPTIVLEKDPIYVGGISRTIVRNGYRFDLGGHRFFSKNQEITAWWQERLPDDFIVVQRKSRIVYRGRFFNYPLRPANALANLGLWTSLTCVLSYLGARLFPRRPEKSFEDWVSNRFGRRLFRIFFKTYTEKVWGISTAELSADWAAQRIQGLSLFKAVFSRGRQPTGRNRSHLKTLTETFHYPRRGPGQMWERTAAEFQRLGGQLELGASVTQIRHEAGRVTSVTARTHDGREQDWSGTDFIVSMPLKELVEGFIPPLPAAVRAAAAELRYRDFITVALIVQGPNPFPDNWIYVHDPSVKVGRIQNFGNWSTDMVPERDKHCLGLEYFCAEGDELWRRSDAALLELAKNELATLGLAQADTLIDGTVVRVPKAYPVYDERYRDNVGVIRSALARFAGNLQPVGRNGMHKYNNQDHSMMTAMLAVRNLQGGHYDLWRVNTDAEYHEAHETNEPAFPTPVV